MNDQSAIDFPGNRRIHIALAVTDLDRSRDFYETLLGIAPSKERPGYVKFEPQDPSVNLTLNEVEAIDGIRKSATHYGIQLKSKSAVQEAVARLTSAGLVRSVQEDTTCCYAVQDKVWVEDPDGNAWEVFVVTEADTEQHSDAGGCCVTTADEPAASCC